MAVRSALLHDERFVIPTSDAIAIEGNKHVTKPQLLSIFGGDVERISLRLSLAERRAELERLPWVEHATVMRLLPDRLRGFYCGAGAGGVCAAGESHWAGG